MNVPIAVQYASERMTGSFAVGADARLSVRDSFQGALLGLRLVPIALRMSEDAHSALGPIYDDAASTRLLRNVAVDVLRYCNCRLARKQAITSTLGDRTSDFLVPFVAAGDWIAHRLDGKPVGINDLDISDLASQNTLSVQQRDEYCDFHATLRRCAKGSYAQSVQLAVEEVLDGSLLISRCSVGDRKDTVASAQLIPAIVGFVMGAQCGVAQLPVLWQLALRQDAAQRNDIDREETLRIANKTYERWAGVLDKT